MNRFNFLIAGILVAFLVLAILIFRTNEQEPPEIEVLIDKTLDGLFDSPYVEFDFQYVFEGFLKDKEKPLQGKVKLAPQKNQGPYAFGSMHVLAKDNDDNPSFELAKIDGEIYYRDYKKDHIEFSPLHRLGAPLYSIKVENTMLLYQYISILEGYQQFKPVLGERAAIDNKKCQEIIFDIPQYDFYVRFWIDYKKFKIKRIVNLQRNGKETGKIVYHIKDFQTKPVEQPEDHFQISQLASLKVKEFSNGGPVVGEKAPTWELDNLEKTQKLALSQLKGKVVLLDFWATWCEPCKKVMPEINKLYKEYKGQEIEFIGITYKEKGDPLTFINNQKYAYTFLEGHDDLGGDYGLKNTGLPSFFILDQEGTVVEFESGYQGQESIKRIKSAIDKLL